MPARPPCRRRPAIQFAACALALLASLPQGAEAQRARDRHEREREERQREQREQREEREERERRERRERESWRVRVMRVERAGRELGDDRWERPRASLGAGLDFRRFGTEGRYLAHGGVDFQSRTGLGLRPEVLFGWSAQPEAPSTTGGPAATVYGRSRMLGIALSGTYTFARRSPVRPYVLSGVGMFSTRLPRVDAPIPGQTRATIPARTVLDAGLTAGAGLELSLGPVRLFTELRYLLLDGGAGTAGSPGFAGMLPLTAGIRF